MSTPNKSLSFSDYCDRLHSVLTTDKETVIQHLCDRLLALWNQGNQLFICGNGGSAGNAIHLSNDFVYGIDAVQGRGLRAHALSANPSIVTCLANDEGYDRIFVKQLEVYGQPGDVLIVLSGSGNSPNVISALQYAKENGMETFAILGFDGGKAKEISDNVIHFPIADMQISEDAQTIVLHYVMQWLRANKMQDKN